METAAAVSFILVAVIAFWIVLISAMGRPPGGAP